MKTCRWSLPVLVGPSAWAELTFSMNGAVTPAPAAGADEAAEPLDPEEPLEAEGLLVPHAATVSSAAAPVANTNVRWDRICVLLQRIYWALVVDYVQMPRPVQASWAPRLPRPTLSESATRRTP